MPLSDFKISKAKPISVAYIIPDISGMSHMIRLLAALTLLVAMANTASPAERETIDTPSYLHIYLGGSEIWIPNFPGITLHGPDAPVRGEYSGPRYQREGQDGDIYRFIPIVGEPPYFVKSIFIAKIGGSSQGPNEILASNGDLELLKGITGIQMKQAPLNGGLGRERTLKRLN